MKSEGQLFLNLLTNANYATSGSGKVNPTATATEAGTEAAVELQFIDTGKDHH